MDIMEGLHTLLEFNRYHADLVHAAQNAVADPNLHGFEQILHMHGQWIMILICLFLLWLRHQETI